MRRLVLVAVCGLLSLAARADHYVFAAGAFTFVTDADTTVEVPDVVGEADFAAADAVLEGVGLDGGTETAVCSPAAASEIVGQNPQAGDFVELGTLVNLLSSSGTPCTGGPNYFNIGLGLDL